VIAPDPVSVAAGYRFVPLYDPAALRAALLPTATAAGLKGTLLLAPEGINFTLAGADAALRRWVAALQADPRFAALELKWSQAPLMPFQRLKLRLKAEIIRMNQPTVRPASARAPALDAATLARWLDQGHCDEGRPLALLDTRNAWEVDAGAFEGALDWRLSRFSDFPAALAQHRDELAGKTVVSYCTGGIRCEKAALWMAAQGLPHVWQLDGGVLRYFEATAAAPADAAAPAPRQAPHWRGHCAVFDDRGALDAALQPAAGEGVAPGPQRSPVA
jgi:UPF0176 protein